MDLYQRQSARCMIGSKDSSDRRNMTYHFVKEYTRLYRVYQADDTGKEWKEYCPFIAVDDLIMSKDSTVNWECSFCGQVVPSPIYLCPGCQSPRSQAEMTCSVILRGRMPFAAHLLGLGKDNDIELHVGCCGDPRVADPDNMIARFHQFEITELRILHLSRICADDNPGGNCIVTANCKVEFYFDRMLGSGRNSSDRRKEQ